MKKETPLKNRPEIHLSVDSWEVVIYHNLPDLEEEKINSIRGRQQNATLYRLLEYILQHKSIIVSNPNS